MLNSVQHPSEIYNTWSHVSKLPNVFNEVLTISNITLIFTLIDL